MVGERLAGSRVVNDNSPLATNENHDRHIVTLIKIKVVTDLCGSFMKNTNISRSVPIYKLLQVLPIAYPIYYPLGLMRQISMLLEELTDERDFDDILMITLKPRYFSNPSRYLSEDRIR